MITFLDLPDNKFDAAYPEFKKSLNSIFNRKDFQNEIISTANISPMTEEDRKEALEFVNNYIEEIKNDDSLSENKKDILITFIKKSYTSAVELAENPRERVGVKIQLIHPNAKLPQYANPSDAGADIFAVEDITIEPHTTTIVPTGIKVQIPAGYEIQIRPRSGLSCKTSLRIANAPGTIDHLYNKEIGVILENTGNDSYTIKNGDKIAQMLIAPTPMIVWEEVDNIEDSGRGGFGSTDNKS